MKTEIGYTNLDRIKISKVLVMIELNILQKVQQFTIETKQISRKYIDFHSDLKYLSFIQRKYARQKRVKHKINIFYEVHDDLRKAECGRINSLVIKNSPTRQPLS